MRYFVLTAVLAGSLFGQQQDWRFAHPDATLVGGFRPQALLTSPILSGAVSEATKQQPQAAMAIAMAQGLMAGVEEIRFSMQDNGTKEPDFIALVSGSLDDSFLRAMAQDKAKWQRIDAKTIVMGNGKSLERAVTRMQTTAAALQSRTLESAGQLAGYDFWLAGKIPDSATAAMGAGVKLPIKALAFGMNMREGVDMELTAQAATAAQAEALVKSAHEAEESQAPQLRGSLKSFVEGSTAHFRVSVPRDQVLAAMQAQAAKGIPGLSTSAAASAATPRSLAPAAPARKTIIIEGLDDGPKEIPLKK